MIVDDVVVEVPTTPSTAHRSSRRRLNTDGGDAPVHGTPHRGNAAATSAIAAITATNRLQALAKSALARASRLKALIKRRLSFHRPAAPQNVRCSSSSSSSSSSLSLDSDTKAQLTMSTAVSKMIDGFQYSSAEASRVIDINRGDTNAALSYAAQLYQQTQIAEASLPSHRGRGIITHSHGHASTEPFTVEVSDADSAKHAAAQLRFAERGRRTQRRSESGQTAAGIDTSRWPSKYCTPQQVERLRAKNNKLINLALDDQVLGKAGTAKITGGVVHSTSQGRAYSHGVTSSGATRLDGATAKDVRRYLVLDNIVARAKNGESSPIIASLKAENIVFRRKLSDEEEASLRANGNENVIIEDANLKYITFQDELRTSTGNRKEMLEFYGRISYPFYCGSPRKDSMQEDVGGYHDQFDCTIFQVFNSLIKITSNISELRKGITSVNPGRNYPSHLKGRQNNRDNEASANAFTRRVAEMVRREWHKLDGPPPKGIEYDNVDLGAYAGTMRKKYVGVILPALTASQRKVVEDMNWDWAVSGGKR